MLCVVLYGLLALVIPISRWVTLIIWNFHLGVFFSFLRCPKKKLSPLWSNWCKNTDCEKYSNLLWPNWVWSCTNWRISSRSVDLEKILGWSNVWLNLIYIGITARSPRPLPVAKFWHEHVRQQLVSHPLQHNTDPIGCLQVINTYNYCLLASKQNLTTVIDLICGIF